jgi:hypothetical protein
MAADFQTGFELGRHATHLDEVGDALRGVADAARMARVPDDAFGRFCWRFSGMLRPIERSGVVALDRAVAAMDSAAAGIAATVAAYRHVDESLDGKARRTWSG